MKAQCALRHIHQYTMQREVVVVCWHITEMSFTKFCNVVRELEARWSLHAAQDQIVSFASLLNLLIDSFTQC